jgi:hypothetical protein
VARKAYSETSLSQRVRCLGWPVLQTAPKRGLQLENYQESLASVLYPAWALVSEHTELYAQDGRYQTSWTGRIYARQQRQRPYTRTSPTTSPQTPNSQLAVCSRPLFTFTKAEVMRRAATLETTVRAAEPCARGWHKLQVQVAGCRYEKLNQIGSPTDRLPGTVPCPVSA